MNNWMSMKKCSFNFGSWPGRDCRNRSRNAAQGRCWTSVCHGMCVFIRRLGRWVSSDYNDSVFLQGGNRYRNRHDQRKKKDWRVKLKKSQKIKSPRKSKPPQYLWGCFDGVFVPDLTRLPRGHARGRFRTRSDSIEHASQRPWSRLDEWTDPVRSRPASDTFPDPSPESDSSRFVRSLNLPNVTKGKRKQLVNAAIDSDRVSLTKKCQKNWEFTRFMSRECLNEKGWSITKENLPKRTTEKARDPTVEALLEVHDPDGWKSQQPLSRLQWMVSHIS